MSNSNVETSELVTSDMDTNVNLELIKTQNIDHGSVQAVWSGSSHADATLKLQTSHDNVSWDDYPSGSMTLDTVGANSKTLQFPLLSFPYCRFAYDKGSNTTGTVVVRYLFKSKK